MSLPGKLCIGILEEDNPQKSYFRFKPLLVEQDGQYEPFSEKDLYPEDGCIRIVPDKNESSHFKVRMREIGRYCMVDLRAHPGESDKIRPNKNYKNDGVERNTHIIYSDVIQLPPRDAILEILPVEAGADASQMALQMEPPATARVLIKSGGALDPHPWAAAPMPDMDGCISLAREAEALEMDSFQEFHLPGFQEGTLDFVIARPEAVPEPEEKPAAPEKPEEPPVREPAQAREPVPAPVQDKPWLTRTEFPRRPAIDPRMSVLDKALAAQSGMNPRRGRSLQEIIEDKWRHSRLDQLGAPVPAQATGHPAANPVDTAVSAIRQVWETPGARLSLMNAICDMKEFQSAVLQTQNTAQKLAVQEQMDTLEAQRLQLSDEVQRLEKCSDELRAKLKAKIRQEDAAELAETSEKIRAARSELEVLQKDAAALKNAVQDTEKRFLRASDGELEQRVTEIALNNRALRAISAAGDKGGACRPAPIAAREADAGELLEATRGSLRAAGLDDSPAFAATLLYCLAASPVTILSGPSGCGKSAAIRALADAVGLTGCGRLTELRPGRHPHPERPCRAPAEDPAADVPAIALLDDANTAPEEFFPRPCGGEERPRLMLVAQDAPDGHPLPGLLLDQAFLLRMKQQPASAPWLLPEAPEAPALPPVSMSSLRAAFLRRADIPEDVQLRMAKLRRELGALDALISRRALNATACYVSSMIALEIMTPAEALDAAVAQRALPALLASAPLAALVRLPELLADMPMCLALLKQPMPIRI